MTQGKIDLRREHLEASQVIDQAVDSIQYLLAPKGHQIAVSLDRGSLWVDADPARLEQIVANLLANAIQYSEEGSYIRLRAQRQDGEVVISVRDRGQGIRRELLPHVFDLFKQGDRSLARTEGGLGIGLTMVRTLAELHGGTVTASSDGPGRGSEFVVRLPAGRTKDKPAAIQPVSTSVPRRSGNRILVVDDNVDLSRALTTLLSRFGYEAQAVNDGHTAIEAARALRPEVVLLDLGLPGIDGFEVARRLQLRGRLRGGDHHRNHRLRSGRRQPVFPSRRIQPPLDQTGPDRSPGCSSGGHRLTRAERAAGGESIQHNVSDPPRSIPRCRISRRGPKTIGDRVLSSRSGNRTASMLPGWRLPGRLGAGNTSPASPREGVDEP